MPPRLITLTLNPALDLAAEADEVMPTHKVRMHHEHADPGGGGVNVARVLHELGADVVAVIAAGGASGRVLEEMLDEVCKDMRLEWPGSRPRVPRSRYADETLEQTPFYGRGD